MRNIFLDRYQVLYNRCSNEVRGNIIPQIKASVVGALTNLGIGVVMGYPGVTFPHLTHPSKGDFTLNQMDIELFGSLAYVGSVFGCILSGWLMVWYGQRKTLLIALPLAMVGWLLLGIGSSKLMIQLARLLLGIYAGLGYGSACDFVTEISHHSIRGQLSGLVNFSRQLGFLFVYAVGSTSLTWRQLAFFSGGTTLFVPFIGLLGLPDSPRWLASNQRFDEARKSLVLLRGEIYDVDSEFQLIASNIEKGGEIGSIKQQLKEILNPKVLRRFIFLILVYTLFSINGNCSIITFTATIFKEAENYLNEYQSTILTGAVRAVGSLLFLVIGDKYSRRRLTQIPLFFMAICMLSLGFYFYWKVDHDVSFIRWIPLSSVMIHQFFVCLTPISFLPCELLPTSTRSMAGSIIWLVSFGSAFVVIFTFPIMERSIGLHGTFWFYAVNCIVLLLLIISLLPETRGLSLEILNEQVKSPIEKSIADTGSSCIESGTIP